MLLASINEMTKSYIVTQGLSASYDFYKDSWPEKWYLHVSIWRQPHKSHARALAPNWYNVPEGSWCVDVEGKFGAGELLAAPHQERTFRRPEDAFKFFTSRLAWIDSLSTEELQVFGTDLLHTRLS